MPRAARGRPTGSTDKPWRDAIRRAVNDRLKDGGKALDRLARALVSKGYEGDTAALREIGDRLDGKAHQTSDVNVTETRLVARMPHKAKSAEEWADEVRVH